MKKPGLNQCSLASMSILLTTTMLYCLWGKTQMEKLRSLRFPWLVEVLGLFLIPEPMLLTSLGNGEAAAGFESDSGSRLDRIIME